MSVRVEADIVFLEGACPVGDAEPLLAALQDRTVTVDLSGATRLHLAVVQLLLVGLPASRGVPADPFLRDYILPMLRQVSGKDAIARESGSI